jgi:manganese transport protein
MGEFVNGRWLQGLAWVVAVLIAGLNGWLLVQTAMGF